MAIVTLTDISMRALGSPIVGSLEIITFLGAIVIGFALPYTSLLKGHVYVDVLVDKLSPRGRNIFMALTRCMGIFLFIFIGLNFINYGIRNIGSGEVTPAFRIPVYPIAFGLAASFFVQSFTLLAELIQIVQGKQT
jgi:TRAP-type C4-dicarboxylate transport system permease small subunit